MDESYEDFKAKNPHLKDFLPYIERLGKESDRGRVLISTGYIEQLLKDVLQAYFIEGNSANSLFDEGALATFSSRAHLCHALGLISDDEYHDIQLIRKIRNHLAHKMHSSFEDSQVIDRCKLLLLKAHDYGEVVTSPSGQFQTAAVSVLSRLVNRAQYVSEKRISYGNWLH